MIIEKEKGFRGSRDEREYLLPLGQISRGGRSIIAGGQSCFVHPADRARKINLPPMGAFREHSV